MTARRVDRIAEILEDLGGEAQVREVAGRLVKMEGNPDITAGSITVAINNENDRLRQLGQRDRFKTFSNGGKWGWVSFQQATASTPGTSASEIEKKIHAANERLDKELGTKLAAMDWRTFESSFLQTVLENLGFQEVEITQATRDGGVDARIRYKLGVVDTTAIVSAKKWASGTVPVAEVRNLRGIPDEASTGIIITTSKFTAEAKEEARPRQGMRLICLIDGMQLIDVMKRNRIGVKKQEMPELLVLDEDLFRTAEVPEETLGRIGSPDDAEPGQPAEAGKLKRFWENMLDDLSTSEIADLLGLKESSVKVYMNTPPRREKMAKRIREDDSLKATALSLVERARAAK